MCTSVRSSASSRAKKNANSLLAVLISVVSTLDIPTIKYNNRVNKSWRKYNYYLYLLGIVCIYIYNDYNGIVPGQYNNYTVKEEEEVLILVVMDVVRNVVMK